MKKMIALIAAMMLFAGVAVASSDYEGKVTDVSGDKVTVEITKGKAAKIKVGDSVELEVKEGKAPKKGGMGMLQGC